MNLDRGSGILLHPTSLPGRFGIGDLGPEASAMVDWLSAAGQSYWQMLPLGVPGDISCPYQALSAAAGNPLLISPELLARDGLLDKSDLEWAASQSPPHPTRVDFARVERCKRELLDRAAIRFRRLPSGHPLREEYRQFASHHVGWLRDHALFLALHEANDQRPWTDWTFLVAPDKRPTPGAPAALADEVQRHQLVQWFFHRQWETLRDYAWQHGVRLIGDLPIYVAHDSVDVWAHRELFQLDRAGIPTQMAGVPPDYFSATGQLWNNPVYDWDAHARDGYRWWIDRMAAALELVDFVRLDHFRGFEAYWAVPAGELTAENGHWYPGPGAALLEALRHGLARPSTPSGNGEPSLPLIAEDLGFITEEVIGLRDQFSLPGMEVLQFLWFYDEKRYLPPDRFPTNLVVYTGTHDNNTTRGWFDEVALKNPPMLERLRQYTPAAAESIAWELIELAWHSTAAVAVAPLQDVLGLGSQSRMNTPGTRDHDPPNWSWRVGPGMLSEELAGKLAELTRVAGRQPMSPART